MSKNVCNYEDSIFSMPQIYGSVLQVIHVSIYIYMYVSRRLQQKFVAAIHRYTRGKTNATNKARKQVFAAIELLMPHLMYLNTYLYI